MVSRVTDVPAGPARGMVTIIKADAPLARQIRALLVIDAGAVKITCGDDSVVTTPALAAGTLIACVIKQVWSTGTAPTLFLGYY